VETTIVESIQEGPAVVPVLKSLAEKGHKLIFANGFGYATFVPAVADQFPSTVFIVQQANPKAPNVGSYYGYLEQARYLQGVVAGLTTKTNRIGFVGAYSFPPVIAGVNAFALGAQSVNPKAVMKVNWVNSWNDPPKEKEAAEALLNDGADVIGNHSDSAATLRAAADRGKWGMSSNSNRSAAAPQAFLTANVWNWGIYYVEVAKQVREGTYTPGRFMGSLKNGVVALAPYGQSVSPQARQAADKAREAIIAEKQAIFAGPITDNQGAARVPAGQTMPLVEASSTMKWLVRGVEGTVK
jgi:basic membrane protein A